MLTLKLRFLLSFTGALLATTVLFLLSTPQHHTHLLHFWHYDLPPLPPSLRILGYTGILLIALVSYISRPPFGDSPVQAPELYRFTLPSFFSLEGAMALFGRKWISYERLRVIRGVMVVAWLLCVVGGGGWVARVVCGVCMFVLHGVVSGCIGTSHRWYVPVYTLLALMAADGNYDHSLDNWLHDRYPHLWPFHSTLDSTSFLHTGFARKLILLSSIATLFYGGITKILNGGWKWLNGRSLAYYVSSEENGRSALLKKLMHTQPVLSFFLAVSSIVLECGAVLALWNQWWRPIILANAAAFHFGIWLTMWPNYAPQTFCYGLGHTMVVGGRPALPLAHPTLAATLAAADVGAATGRSLTTPLHHLVRLPIQLVCHAAGGLPNIHHTVPYRVLAVHRHPDVLVLS